MSGAGARFSCLFPVENYPTHGLLRTMRSRNPETFEIRPDRATFSRFGGSRSHPFSCKHEKDDLLTLCVRLLAGDTGLVNTLYEPLLRECIQNQQRDNNEECTCHLCRFVRGHTACSLRCNQLVERFNKGLQLNRQRFDFSLEIQSKLVI